MVSLLRLRSDGEGGVDGTGEATVDPGKEGPGDIAGGTNVRGVVRGVVSMEGSVVVVVAGVVIVGTA